jgi:hypothetical protein
MEDINAPFILLVTLTLRRSKVCSSVVRRQLVDRISACTPLFALLRFVKHASTCRLRAMRERDSWLLLSLPQDLFLLFKQQCRNSPCMCVTTTHTTQDTS